MNEQMKQYTGTKTVKAMPMTMGEAYERKLLKEGVRPSECETDKAGYLVEYEDGYQSWSPADVFDKAYKPSETFLERMQAECNENFERLKKAVSFIESDKFNELGLIARILIATQASIQREYGWVLADTLTEFTTAESVPSYYNFGTAIRFLKAGGAIRRAGWNGKGLFVVKQVPAHITADIIPNMQSLPQSAKDIIMARAEPHIAYTNQMLIIHPDGRADSWVPSSSDVFAEDWELVTE